MHSSTHGTVPKAKTNYDRCASEMGKTKVSLGFTFYTVEKDNTGNLVLYRTMHLATV